MENESPIACVVAGKEMDLDESVTKSRFVRPSNGDLLELSLILLERPMHYFLNGMYWEGSKYNTWWDTEFSMGLYQDSYEQENVFDEVVRITAAPSGVRFFMVTPM